MADNIPLPSEPAVVRELLAQFGSEVCTVQATLDQVPTLWVPRERLIEVLRFLRNLPKPYVMLYDLSAIDERLRKHRQGQPRPTSRCSITCCRSSETVMSASRLRCPRATCRCRRLFRSGRTPTGTSAKSGTCSASPLPATPASPASCCHATGPAIRCARTIRRAPPSLILSCSMPPSRMPSRKRCASSPKSGA
jgi:hypothetical protein